jgi:hypothetical protein
VCGVQRAACGKAKHTHEAIHAKHMPTCSSTPGKTVFCHLKHCEMNAISLSSFKDGWT